MPDSISDVPEPVSETASVVPMSSAQDSQHLRVLIRALAWPDQIEQARLALMKITDPILANPDCLEFRVYQVRDDPRTFLLLEQWVSEEALVAHGKRDYMADYMAQKDTLFESLGGDFLKEVTESDKGNHPVDQ